PVLPFPWKPLRFVGAYLLRESADIEPKSSIHINARRSAGVCGGVRDTIGGLFLSPSPCTQGEGWGGGRTSIGLRNPHPDPPPEYREREQKTARRLCHAPCAERQSQGPGNASTAIGGLGGEFRERGFAGSAS